MVKNQFFSFLLSFFVTTSVIPISAFATTCADLLIPKLIWELPRVTSGVLSESQKLAIALHTDVINLRKKHGKGKKLVVAIWNYLEGAKVTENYAGMGEAIQALFLHQVLMEIFPHLKIVPFNGIRKAEASKRTFAEFQLLDVSEVGSQSPDAGSDKIPMSSVKAANGTTASLRSERQKMRNIFGFTGSDRVTSVYVDLPAGTRYDSRKRKPRDPNLEPTTEEFMAEVFRVMRPNIVIATSTFDSDRGGWASLSRWAASEGIKVVALSELGPNYFLNKEHGKTLVINDTRGFLPAIHAAANNLVIRGPINLFEGLSVGTPTLIFNNQQTMDTFNFDHYLKLQRLAVETGGAAVVTQMSDLANGVSHLRALHGHTIVEPWRLGMSDFLSLLARKLAEQGI